MKRIAKSFQFNLSSFGSIVEVDQPVTCFLEAALSFAYVDDRRLDQFKTLQGQVEKLLAERVVLLLVFELFNGTLVGLVHFNRAGAVIAE
ncbi:hypothetical protein D3C87_1568710 [compost metagenome]